MNGSRAIAVLGGGITGLTAAYRLHELGHRVRLFEASSRLGGAINTELADGWLIEDGPNSLQLGDAGTAELLHQLDLDREIVEPAALAKNRYIARGERLIPLPASGPALLTSPLFSFGAKLRVLREFGRGATTRQADVSVAEFTEQHFGPEVLERVIQPFVSGIYAGDPAKLSARHAFPKLWAMEQSHGSLLRAQIAAAKARRQRGEPAAPKIISFRRGLQTLPLALAARMGNGTLTLSARVEKLVPGNSWQVGWRDATGARVEEFDAVISTLPAAGLSSLVIGTGEERPLASLAAINHPPVSSLFLGFKREQVSHALDGFGALIPAVEKRPTLGIIFASSLFPDRAPAGHVALTVMIGGALQPELASGSAAELWSLVRPDLRELLGVSGEPVFQRHTFWPKAIPQYDLGYERHLATMTACEHGNPGFFIGGQVRDGIALPSCLAAGERLAARATNA